jgi:hypothetical protein
LAPVEFARTDTGVVCAETLDGLGALVVGEEACGFDVVFEFPVDEGGGDDCDEADEEEDAVSRLVIVHPWNWRRG